MPGQDNEILAATSQQKRQLEPFSFERYLTWIPPRDRTLLLLIILVGFLMRIWDLGRPSFWYDEVLTLNRSESLFEDSKGLLLRPPCYYFLAWLSIQFFGASEISLRLPSVLFGTLSIPLVYIFTARIQRSNNVANQPILAAALLTIFPLHIAVSREAKEYALLAFLVLLVMFLVVEAVHRKSLKLVFAGAVIQAIAFFTNFLAFTVFFPVCFFLWLRWPREKRSNNLEKTPIYATGIFSLFPTLLYGFWLLIPREGFHEPTKGLELSNWVGFEDVYWYLLLLLLYIGGGLLLVFKTLFEWYSKREDQVFVFAYYVLVFLVLSAYRLKAQRYFAIAVPITVILLAEGLKWLYESLSIEKPDFRTKKAKFLVIIGLIGSTLLMPTLFILGFLAGDAQAGYHPDWRGACAYVKAKANPEEDTFWSTHGTTGIATHYLGEEYQVGDVVELENMLPSLRNLTQGQIWIIVTKNRFERKIPQELQRWIIAQGSLVWDTRAEDLTTQMLADTANDLVSLFGVNSMKWWSLDRMHVYIIQNHPQAL
ncbi:MAG: glycosyltransferase family 39 protein [Candidatus Hodarchaeota archaeon]